MLPRACVLVFACLAATASARMYPTAPADTVVAMAQLTAVSGINSTGKGWADLVLPRPSKANATLSIALSGSLANITMAHIHVFNATAGNPPILGLLPHTNSLALLDPTLTFKGHLSFKTTWTQANLAAWGGPDMATFLAWLKAGKLFVNVHTTAHPAGELQGTLMCKAPCAWPVCSGTKC